MGAREGERLHIAIAGCGGVIGRHLIEWLLGNSDATVVGCDASYERLGNLLESGRFSYYFADEVRSDELLLQLVRDADVLVDLRGIEQGGAAVPAEVSPAAAQRGLALANACMAARTRLVYVESVRISAEGSARRHQDGVSQWGSSDVAATGELQFVVVQLPDVLGDQLEVVPRSAELSSLERLRDAFLMAADEIIEVRPSDLKKRTFLYVPDAASALGRVAISSSPDLLGRVIQVGNPRAYLTTAELLRAVIEAYRRHYWDRSSPGPYLTGPSETECESSDPIVDIKVAQDLLGWRPRWPLSRAVNDALPRLLGS